MAQPLMQTVSLRVSQLGLTTVLGPNLVASLTFAAAGLEVPIASPFFKPAEGDEELPEPITLRACPWLPPELPLAQRLIRLALRAAHEALDAHLEEQGEDAPRPGVWLVVPAERPGVSQAALSELSDAIWRELRPHDVRVFTDETGTMQAIQDIARALNAGEASALLLAVDSYFCPEIAAQLIAEPTTPWEHTPPTPSEAAAALLFTGEGPFKTGSRPRALALGEASGSYRCAPNEGSGAWVLKGGAGAVPSNPPKNRELMSSALASSRPSNSALGAAGHHTMEGQVEDPLAPATLLVSAETSPFVRLDRLLGAEFLEDEGLLSSALGVEGSGGDLSLEDEGPLSAALVSSRLSSTALGAEGSGGIARVICAGAMRGLAAESNDELQDGLAMTALLLGLSQGVVPELVVGPSQVSAFRMREWEMAASRAPNRLAREHQEQDVSDLFGWVGAASTAVALVYAIAGTRLGLLQPQDSRWLTAAVWGVAPSGTRGLLGVMIEAQGS